MVNEEAALLVPPVDVVDESRAAEGADGRHVRPHGAVLHYLEIQSLILG